MRLPQYLLLPLGALALSATHLLPPPVNAQAPPPPATPCDGKADVTLDQWVTEVATRAGNGLMADAPLETPAADQLTAVGTGAADSTSMVQGAGVPTLFALAAERGLASASDGKITINLSPFTIATALDPTVLDRQSLYEQRGYSIARRFGLAVTLGGEGDSFDRDGDGTADPALEASDLQDIVAWEVRVRLLGSRDRRDPKNYRVYFDEVSSEFEKSSDLYVAITTMVAPNVPKLVSTTNSACLSRAKLDALLSSEPTLAKRIAEATAANVALRTKAEAAAKKVDDNPLLSLVVGGLERRDDFGPDKLTAGLRGAWGGPNRNLALNIDWAEIDAEGDQPTTWKAGLEYSVLVLKGSPLAVNGVKVAGAAVYEHYQNVPGAKHDTISRASAKLELPVAEGVKVPISVTWSNHKDLLEGESEIRGHFGFTFDLSAARKKLFGQ